MYCGAKMAHLEDKTIKELFEAIPESMLNAKVKVFSNEKFYVHFDVEGEFINIDTRPWSNMYGSIESETCSKCPKFVNKKCTCDGSNCINFAGLSSDKSVAESLIKADAMNAVYEVPVAKVDEPNLNKTVYAKETVEEVIEDTKEDEDTLTVNGVPFMDVPKFIQDYNKNNKNKAVKAEKKQSKPVDIKPSIIKDHEVPKQVKPVKSDIEVSVEAAMKNVLSKMLKALD